MESLYLPLREEAFGLPFFHYLKRRRLACLLACQPVSNRSNGVTCMWLSPNYIYIPPISVVGKKRTLRICSLLCSHLSLEAQKKESIHTHMSHIPKHWALFFVFLSFLYFDGAHSPASTDWLTGLIMAPRSISNSTFTSSSLLAPLAPQEPWEKAWKQLPRPLFSYLQCWYYDFREASSFFICIYRSITNKPTSFMAMLFKERTIVLV